VTPPPVRTAFDTLPPDQPAPPRTRLSGARGYCLAVLGAALALLLATVAASVALDPYRVLDPLRANLRNFEPNQRAVKLAWLQANACGGAEVFVLGASRANAYPTQAVEALLGGPAYSFAVAGETVDGMRRRALWLLQHCRPRHLLVTLDPLQFDWPADYGADLLRGEPPETGGPSRARFLLRYLLLPPAAIWIAGREALWPRPELFIVNRADGTHRGPSDPPDGAGPRPLRRGHLPIVCHAPERARPDLVAANLDRLRQLVDAARQQGVAVTALVHPVNQNQLALKDASDVVEWAEAVARITDRLLFFGGYNDFSTDDGAYFDLSHFDIQAGRLVIETAARSTVVPPEGLVGLYDAASAPLLRARLAENMAARIAACR
jgi:hypothetical protein